MPLILGVVLIAFFFINRHIQAQIEAQKKKQRQEPVLQKWSEDSLEYMLMWIIFQEVAQEVYSEWEKRGSPHPIGYYHKDFLTLGQELYDGLYPVEEALTRAKAHMKTLGFDRVFIYQREEYHDIKRIQLFDFPYHLLPDREYIAACHKQETVYYYKGMPISEPSRDDWRKNYYEASDGTRHKLRTVYRGGAFYAHELGRNW